MKKFIVPICIVAALFFAGCGKKCQKREGKEVVLMDPALEGPTMAQNQEIPIYESEEEKFFDFDEGEVKDFAFITDEDEAQEEVTVAHADKIVDDEWEDEDLTLAWEDEAETEESFKVVNFDLNKNAIRADQKNVVEENIKLAHNATKEGKNIVVAGHCCPLGSASYNMSLSERRAKTIRDEMVKKGVPQEKITILGCGSEHPVVLSDSEDRVTKIKELAANRRAEVSVH